MHVDYTGEGHRAWADPTGRVGRGETVGELGLVTGGARAAFVEAAEDCEVVEVGVGAVRAMCAARPSLRAALERAVGEHRRAFQARQEAARRAVQAEMDNLAVRLERAMHFLEGHEVPARRRALPRRRRRCAPPTARARGGQDAIRAARRRRVRDKLIRGVQARARALARRGLGCGRLRAGRVRAGAEEQSRRDLWA